MILSVSAMEEAYRRGIHELTAKLDKDFCDFMQKCQQRHTAGAKRMKKPSLSMRADINDAGQLSIELQFDEKGPHGMKGQITQTFPGATYKEIAELVSQSRPHLCTHAVVSWLVDSSRQRLTAKLFGDVA